MLGSKWYPSVIEDEIYDMMDSYAIGSDTYNEDLTDAIADFLGNYTSITEWKLACSPWPNMAGGVCSVCWIENGHVHLVMFDYQKEEWL